ncbi:MAG TPA: hypothetical protein VGR00_07485 [Thermoanaerobaculia bacterium]|nr:hypothetical protein [Thermoanaerobaculia bacterium]
MRGLRATAVLLLAAATASAHVGNVGVFHEGPAGPYRLLVSVTPPSVIPGVAEVSIRTVGPEVSRLAITPLPLTGGGTALAPKADVALRSKDDPRFFTGTLWLMTAGSWQVRIEAEGAAGKGTLSIPVPALPQKTKGMSTGLALLLSSLGLLLVLGFAAIAGAAAREATLPKGVSPDARARRRGRAAVATGALFAGGVVLLGSRWWDAEAGAYARYVYKPLKLEAKLSTPASGEELRLTLEDPGWIKSRKKDDFLLDHGHPMHLFVVRLPELDRVFHLHPEAARTGEFVVKMPPMPAGRYRLFGDVVHATGLSETAVADMTLPAIAGTPLSGDDSAGVAPPLAGTAASRNESALKDGGRMLFERDGSPLVAGRVALLRFRIVNRDGRDADDLEPYMGMLGHAAILDRNLTVFAHVHPTGSIPMAALAVANPGAPLPGHVMSAEGLPSEVSFPFAFPGAGDYRLFVQVKRAGVVETGVFDVRVEAEKARR